ncbi:MAG: HlyD family efflux transporter periplasmic adaptor subunit [Pseudomonadota bacterium]|nr:HlyD family efflux transporter periplasmic adaptor subunit [Pseudomonadota bacterium]
MHLRNVLLSLLVGGALIAALVYGFRPQPVRVDMVVVKSGPLTVTIAEEGRTRVIDRYIISAPITAMMARIDFDVGDAIIAGDPLVILHPLVPAALDRRSRAQAQARLAAAEATLKAAREEVEKSRAQLTLVQTRQKRITNIVALQGLAQDRLDEMESLVKQSRAGLKSAEFMVEVARYERQAALAVLEFAKTAAAPGEAEKIVLKAPVSGRVLKLFQESAGVVNAGQSLLEIGDPQTLEVEVDLLSADAVRVRPGMQVLFSRWGGKKELSGIVKRVEPRGFTKISALGVEEQRVWVIVDFSESAEMLQHLGDGYRLEANFILWHDDAVLKVPGSALFRLDDAWALFVVEEGRAHQRRVEVGRRGGIYVQILSGLKTGTTVINHPGDTIVDGCQVRRFDKK